MQPVYFGAPSVSTFNILVLFTYKKKSPVKGIKGKRVISEFFKELFRMIS